MVCVCCVEEKTLDKMIKVMQMKMYILGTNTTVGDVNVERLTTVRNITGGVEWRKTMC